MDELTTVKKNYIHYINKIIENQKISHTYLIEMDNYEKDSVYLFDFIKMILCNISYEELETSDNPILSLIDYGNHPDIKIIEPDGNVIKKNQLLELQKEYSNKSLLDGKRIYIIKNSEKLNVSSANTMLKFLEEPEDNIIAFLVTDNRYHVLETILSRCQILTLKEDHFIFEQDDAICDLLKCVIHPKNFFLKYNFFINEVIPDKIAVREKLSIVETIIIYYLNYKYGKEESVYSNYLSILEKIEDEVLLNSLSIIEEEIPKLDFNVNYKLWIDSLFSKLIIGG